MTPEERARQQIDAQLVACGWVIQDFKAVDFSAGRGVALREVPLKTGPCDYLLLVDRQAVGVIETKKEGTTLSTVAVQSARYASSLPDFLAAGLTGPLPFLYESTGVETFFRDERDPDPRSRRVFAFHRPETLAEWAAEPDTLRDRLKRMPFAHPLATNGMRDCQIEAITGLEHSFAEDRPRALIHMATGAGKTFTACAFTYRLIKYAKARRVLFLVDRANLGEQARDEFHRYRTPDTGRLFTELYNVQHLTSPHIDDVCRVTICTIQRLYSILRGEELAEGADDLSGAEIAAALGVTRTRDIAYNPAVPIEMFDHIVTDECHRSIYNLWRQVLEYFDASLIGLTATPAPQTIAYFHQNRVAEYNHERAVTDGVNVGYDVYRIKTKVTEAGGKVDKGFLIDHRSKASRQARQEVLADDLDYTPADLDRSVVVPDQIRTILRTYRDVVQTELFPGRTLVPKTLIFAKDDSHAEDIVHLCREVFGKGNDFCKKITYQAKHPVTGKPAKSKELIREFCLSPTLRIAVTVDMIATGTDIKPLEVLIFLRDVRNVFRNVLWLLKQNATQWTQFQADFRRVFPDRSIEVRFNPEQDEHIHASIISNGAILPIDAAGTGVLQAVQILAYINWSQPKLLILDEPDAHLHPNNQRRLADVLVDLAEERSFQVVLSTHSRHILDALRNDSKIHWIRTGVRVPDDQYSDVEVLLEVGALDRGDLLKSGKTTCVVLTEDDEVSCIEALLGSAGFRMNETEIWPYKGCSNRETALALCGFIAAHAPAVKVVVHRDRDYLTPDEAAEYEAGIKKGAPQAFVFLTKGTDAESEFLVPEHFHQLNAKLEPVKVQQIIEQATTDSAEHSVTAFINSRTPVEAAKLRKENKQVNHGELALACTKLYDGDKTRYRHGKRVLRRVRHLLQTELKLNPNPYTKSAHLVCPDLQKIAVAIWPATAPAPQAATHIEVATPVSGTTPSPIVSPSASA